MRTSNEHLLSLAPHLGAAMPGYDDMVPALDTLAQRIEAASPGVEPELAALLSTLAAHEDPRCVGLYVFAGALAKRLTGDTQAQANLYRSQFEAPQIHLFNLLGRAVPFVGLATRIANDAIMQAMRGHRRPTLIAVGIGTGRQTGLLIESLAAAARLPRSLTVIGVEPSASALEEAREYIEATAARLDAEVSFYGVLGTAESLSTTDWRRIRLACTSRPVVNASFALHHIADDAQRQDQRGHVLGQLHALSPELLVLVEPDVDHLEPRFHARFRNCMQHFGAVFRTLDQLPLAQADRDALKVGFFGREIGDILGSVEAQRSERHEASSSWLARLHAAGFDAGFTGALPASGHDAVCLSHHGRHVSLDAGVEPVVAIFTAVPPALVVARVADQAVETAEAALV